ncbi:MAG TPA: PQQ-binding-like beta-propeller repeat protein [Anaerolineales bacterium]|nr:PQQ-binding-like beta-propeller repeat protein [Anaerolineales bacterium]
MRRIWMILLPLLISALACSALQNFSTPEPVWTYASDRIQVNNYDQLLNEVDGNAYAVLSNEVADVNGMLGLNGVTGQELWPPITSDELLIFEGIYGNRALFKGRASDETNSDDFVLFPIIAYDLETGTEAWRFNGIPEYYSVSMAGNYLFVWKSSTELLILDLQSGEVISTYVQNDVDPSEYAESNSGWVNFIYGEDAFYSLSPAGIWREYSLPNATLVRTQELDVPYYIEDMIIEGGRLYLYAGYEIGQDMSLLAYDLASGEKLWELTSMYGVSRNIQFHNGLAYLNTSQGTSALDVNTGQVLWSTGGEIIAPFVVNAETQGKLLVINNNLLIAFDAQSGEKAWAFEPGLENTLQLTAEGGAVFVTSGDDPPAFQSGIVPIRLDAVDIATGKSIWRFEQSYVSLPIRAGDLIVVAYHQGVSAFPLK